jgi:heat shock protein HslJ
MMRRVLTTIVLAGVTAACGGITEPSDTIGESWRLVSIQEAGSPPTTVENPSRYTLRLGDDGRVAVMSDCNSCGGSYTLSDSSLSFEGLVCTKVACEAGSLDPVFIRALEGATTATVDDEDLIINGSGVTLRFSN